MRFHTLIAALLALALAIGLAPREARAGNRVARSGEGRT